MEPPGNNQIALTFLERCLCVNLYLRLILHGSVRLDRRLHQCLDARRQTGEFARNGIFMRDALAGGALHLRLGRLEGGGGGFLVAPLDRLLHFLDEASHPRRAGAIALAAACVLADTFTGRGGIGHGIS